MGLIKQQKIIQPSMIFQNCQKWCRYEGGKSRTKIRFSLISYTLELGVKFQNIFPLAKVSFAKGKCQALAGTLRNPNGENKGNFGWCLGASSNTPNSYICETILYFEFTTTNCVPGKNLWAEIFGPKVGKVGYFQHFFQFFEYNFRNINFRRKNLTT